MPQMEEKSQLFELNFENFLDFFGITNDQLPSECKTLIAETDFRYRLIQGNTRDNLILEVLKKIDLDQKVVGTPERRDIWQKGWDENLNNFIKSGYDLNELVPKFLRPDQPIRLNGNYVIPCNPKFELSFLKVLRLWLFKTYFQDIQSVYEFGCGTGIQLVELAQIYNNKKDLHGLDFVPSSVELVNQIGNAYKWNIRGHLFDMTNPDMQFSLNENSAVVTFASIEQIAGNFENFIQYILHQKPKICINIEPMIELYDENFLIDYLAIKFHKKRRYSEQYLSRIRELETQGKVEIVKLQRVKFGSLFTEGYNYLVWRVL